MSVYPEPYPLYTEPIEFSTKIDSERNFREAQKYLDWFKSSYIERVLLLLSYFGVRLTSNPRENVLSLSKEVSQCVSLSWCGAISDSSEFVKYKNHTLEIPAAYDLTPAGRSLAIDMGLLTAHAIIQAFSLDWTLVKSPKSDINYHSPVLDCGNYHIYEPKRISIGILSSIGDGEDASLDWVKWFDRCATTV